MKLEAVAVPVEPVHGWQVLPALAAAHHLPAVQQEHPQGAAVQVVPHPAAAVQAAPVRHPQAEPVRVHLVGRAVPVTTVEATSPVRLLVKGERILARSPIIPLAFIQAPKHIAQIIR